MSWSAVWSDRVETIRLPWLLKLAATTFRCFAWLFLARALLIPSTMMLGSGLLSIGRPCGENWTTILERWNDVFGFFGVQGSGPGG